MIYKRGKAGTYWFRFRFAGRFVHESARTQSKTLARDAERQRRRELEMTWNRIERRTLPPPFEQAATQWLEAAKPRIAERTHEIYDVAIRCHLTPALGSMLLCDINAREIAAYQARRKDEGASGRTLNKELQVLRQVLKRYKLWAMLQGEVKFEREHANIGKALTPEEETKLLTACGSNALLYSVVSVALNTALRKNEIRTLRWSQIDLFNRTLIVGRAKTEGVGSSHSTAWLTRLLCAGRDASPLLCPSIMSSPHAKTPVLIRSILTRPTLMRRNQSNLGGPPGEEH